MFFKPFGPCHRQAPGRILSAKQQIGGCPSALVYRPPHLKNRHHSIHPRKRHGLAGVENDDGVWIDGTQPFEPYP